MTPDEATDASALRPADVVMSARRALAVVPNALSFPRQVMRELVRDRWRIEKDRFALDANGCGEILYRVHGGGRTFHFFLLSNALPEAQKTDRNFAAGWDAMGVLCEGEWSAEREVHLRREIPKQRAGIADYDTLIYARGNRSGRVFEEVVSSLAAGQQPDPALIAPIGYILRTTAFIGNGQLGTRPHAGLPPDHPLHRPYHVQFCSAFVLREFVFDLVEHMARARNPRAARLAPALRRYIGIGNSAATGLSAFVANHPHFMHCWSLAYERALAQACMRPMAGADAQAFERLLAKAIRYFTEGVREQDGVFAEPQAVAKELAGVRDAYLRMRGRTAVWRTLVDWAAQHATPDAREVLHAILGELDPEVPARFADAFFADERAGLAPSATLATLSHTLDSAYAWALAGPREASAPRYFWYRSTSAPRDVRRGLRGQAPELEVETNMDTLHKARALAAALAAAPTDATVADLVHARPDLRHFVARVQSLTGCDYAELRDPWLAGDFSPFGSIRFALAFFGMEKFEAAFPKSVRGTFMQGAPIAEDVASGRDGDWPFPLMPDVTDAPTTMLAPLPAVTPYSPATSDEDTRDHRRIAPNELARMVCTALQGHGMALGVAEDAAELAVLAEREGESGVAAVVRHCAEGLCRPGHDRDATVVRSTSSHLALEGDGRSALLLAPIALDLACAHALRGGEGLVAARDMRDPWLIAGLPLRAARHDCVGIALWQSASLTRGVAFAMAGRDVKGTWFARGEAASLAALRERLQASAPLDACAKTLERAAVDGGFVALALRSPVEAASAFLDALIATGLARIARSGEEMACRERAAYREGIAVTRATFDDLAAAGRALLLPQEQEPRVLPVGADPLKTF